MTEEKLMDEVEKMRETIKIGLLRKRITQVKLSEMIGEGTVQVNRAINGDMSPKSSKIRQKIYKVLDIQRGE